MEVHFLPSGLNDLSRLDAATMRRIVRRIDWLANNFTHIEPERLKGELAPLLKFRVGDYRILYQVIDQENSLIIHRIGHRREIYS